MEFRRSRRRRKSQVNHSKDKTLGSFFGSFNFNLPSKKQKPSKKRERSRDTSKIRKKKNKKNHEKRAKTKTMIKTLTKTAKPIKIQTEIQKPVPPKPQPVEQSLPKPALQSVITLTPKKQQKIEFKTATAKILLNFKGQSIESILKANLEIEPEETEPTSESEEEETPIKDTIRVVKKLPRLRNEKRLIEMICERRFKLPRQIEFLLEKFNFFEKELKKLFSRKRRITYRKMREQILWDHKIIVQLNDLKKFTKIQPDMYDFSELKIRAGGRTNIYIKPLLLRSREFKKEDGSDEEKFVDIVDWEGRAKLFTKSVYSLIYTKHKEFIKRLTPIQEFDCWKTGKFHSGFMFLQGDDFLVRMLPDIRNEYLQKVTFKNEIRALKIQENRFKEPDDGYQQQQKPIEPEHREYIGRRKRPEKNESNKETKDTSLDSVQSFQRDTTMKQLIVDRCDACSTLTFNKSLKNQRLMMTPQKERKVSDSLTDKKDGGKLCFSKIVYDKVIENEFWERKETKIREFNQKQFKKLHLEKLRPIINHIFKTSKKKKIELDILVRKLISKNNQIISKDEMKDLLLKGASLYSNWLKITKFEEVAYISVDWQSRPKFKINKSLIFLKNNLNNHNLLMF